MYVCFYVKMLSGSPFPPRWPFLLQTVSLTRMHVSRFVCLYVCLYVYVCMYVRMYVCEFVCINDARQPTPPTLAISQQLLFLMCLYVCMYECMYVCMYVCIYVRMYVCLYVYVLACLYVCILCLYIHTYVCMHVCMYKCNKVAHTPHVGYFSCSHYIRV